MKIEKIKNRNEEALGLASVVFTKLLTSGQMDEYDITFGKVASNSCLRKL
jgi:hypothetical protein